LDVGRGLGGGQGTAADILQELDPIFSSNVIFPVTTSQSVQARLCMHLLPSRYQNEPVFEGLHRCWRTHTPGLESGPYLALSSSASGKAKDGMSFICLTRYITSRIRLHYASSLCALMATTYISSTRRHLRSVVLISMLDMLRISNATILGIAGPIPVGHGIMRMCHRIVPPPPERVVSKSDERHFHRVSTISFAASPSLSSSSSTSTFLSSHVDAIPPVLDLPFNVLPRPRFSPSPPLEARARRLAPSAFNSLSSRSNFILCLSPDLDSLSSASSSSCLYKYPLG
ncbi:hypothetical protein F5148DRAFT_1309855, partial [Russula earlei]